jgi:hypothetical protein
VFLVTVFATLLLSLLIVFNTSRFKPKKSYHSLYIWVSSLKMAAGNIAPFGNMMHYVFGTFMSPVLVNHQNIVLPLFTTFCTYNSVAVQDWVNTTSLSLTILMCSITQKELNCCSRQQIHICTALCNKHSSVLQILHLSTAVHSFCKYTLVKGFHKYILLTAVLIHN